MASEPEDKTSTADEQLRKDTASMNQELMIAVVRQHELTETAEKLSAELRTEMAERRRMEDALRESEAKYLLLFENMLDGFAYGRMLYDEQGRPEDLVYLEVNSSFGRLTGLKDVIGRKITEVIPGVRESNPELFEVLGLVARTGVPDRFEIGMKPLAMWFSVSVYSAREEHFVAIFDNITERKDIERQKADLAAMITHDIRSPLSVISAYAEILASKADMLDADTSDMISVIKTSGEKVENLVRGITLISKQGPGEIMLERASTDITALLLDACKEIKMSAEQKDIVIITEPLAKVPIDSGQ